MGKNYKNAAYTALQASGASLPEQRNLANLAGTIQGEFVRDNSLTSLKSLLQYNLNVAREKFPIGAEIDDKYNNVSNPWIVGQYLTNENNYAYGGGVGVILIRKYVEPTSAVFGPGVDYTTSSIKVFLETTYYNNCSDELRGVVSELAVPCYADKMLQAKLFLMSDREICSNRSNPARGIMWDYWKEKTGLSSPSYSANAGRIVGAPGAAGRSVWTRSDYDTSRVCYLSNTGSVSYDAPSANFGVLPACFVSVG